MNLGGYVNHIGRINLSTGTVNYEEIPEEYYTLRGWENGVVPEAKLRELEIIE
jgi:aldehyde:ferredoxin oxidoreductase